jgi:hypothetical protein
MSEQQRDQMDRRGEEDRRRAYDVDHFATADSEQRDFKERRSPLERRFEWIRIGKWVSILASALGWHRTRKPRG